MAAVRPLESSHIATEKIVRRLPEDIKQRILRAVAGIEYGSIEVVIHNGRVVQIECRERIRVDHDDPESKAAKP